jgi:hypothetical protein
LSGAESRAERTLAIAERVRQHLSAQGVESALIGAMALAVHNYPRSTEDLDIATATDPFTVLRELVTTLRGEGLAAELNEPDRDDPLGGVVNVRGDDFELVQVVNFLNPLGGAPNPGADAIRSATPIPGMGLKVADLSHLIALKLYAGGAKSKLDVIELLARNPGADRAAIRAVCARHRLDAALDSILGET